MTVLFPNGDLASTAADEPVVPGAAPQGSGAMQGNPAAAQLAPFGVHPPAPQPSPSVGLHYQQSNGNVPSNAQPTNVPLGAGNDSLLAQLSRGQLILNQSTYGQGGFVPANGATGPQSSQGGQPQAQSIPLGTNAINFATPANYVGN